MIEMLTSFILAGVLALAAVVLTVVGKKMKNKKLAPNSLVGVRSRRACRSRDDWYIVQAACAPYVFLLAIMFLDSAALFVLQGIFNELIPFEIPGIIMIVQSVVGIVLIYRASADN